MLDYLTNEPDDGHEHEWDIIIAIGEYRCARCGVWRLDRVSDGEMAGDE